jgi:hypothetical protein
MPETVPTSHRGILPFCIIITPPYTKIDILIKEITGKQ